MLRYFQTIDTATVAQSNEMSEKPNRPILYTHTSMEDYCLTHSVGQDDTNNSIMADGNTQSKETR